jgi:hypothetical protein
VFFAKSSELLEKKRVEFFVKAKRVWNNIKRKGIGRAERGKENFACPTTLRQLVASCIKWTLNPHPLMNQTPKGAAPAKKKSKSFLAWSKGI